MEQLYILMPDARVATETDPPPFRLQDLPDELQIKVYQKYFEGTRLKLDKYEGSANKLLFSGMPSLNVELVCRDMHIEARKARSQQTHRYLITCETHMLSPKALDLFTEDARYVWIREHIDMLLLRDIARPLHEPMDWDRLVERCPRLQRVTLLLQRPLWRANQLKIADEYCPASFTYVRSRDRVKTNLRKQLRMEEHSARIMEAFDPDALCRILAQRTPQYRVVLFSANMFTDAGSIDLYRATVTRTYNLKGVHTQKELHLQHGTIKSWYEEMEKAGEVDNFKQDGGKVTWTPEADTRCHEVQSDAGAVAGSSSDV